MNRYLSWFLVSALVSVCGVADADPEAPSQQARIEPLTADQWQMLRSYGLATDQDDLVNLTGAILSLYTSDTPLGAPKTFFLNGETLCGNVVFKHPGGAVFDHLLQFSTYTADTNQNHAYLLGDYSPGTYKTWMCWPVLTRYCDQRILINIHYDQAGPTVNTSSTFVVCPRL